MPTSPFTQAAPATRTCPFCNARIPADLPDAGGAAPRCPQCAKELPKKGELGPVMIKLFGLALVVLGGLLTYWYCYEPWQKIRDGEPATLSFKGAAFGPALTVLGVAVFLPNRPPAGEPESLVIKLLRGLLLTLIFVGLAAGIAIYFLLRSFARDHGYDI